MRRGRRQSARGGGRSKILRNAGGHYPQKTEMRQVILNLAVTLDGYIEGPNGEYDWCFTDQDYGMGEFMKRTDAIFFGRKSYEVLMRTEKNPYPEKKKYVFSKSMKAVPGGAQIVGKDFVEEVVRIKNLLGKDIWLFGGASLTSSFLNAGLVDELQLSIHPILLGKGKPLFKDIHDKTKFTLLNARSDSTGLVQLFYRREETTR
jgi:dihydrofolate reductase